MEILIKVRLHTYLFNTYEELFQIVIDTVIILIVKEEKVSKYFSIIYDSTPDISRYDQLSFIGFPEERFLEFLKNPDHTGKEIANEVINFFFAKGLDKSNCRGPTYDNAVNMLVIYFDPRSRIKDINPLAFFISCSAYSLNLVGSGDSMC